jgi:hypothetical protein
VLSRWEAVVTSLTDGGFVASLVDADGVDGDHEAEFDVEEVSPSDRRLIRPGAVFYWTLGYRDRLSGQRTRESLIRFRRLPAWSTRKLNEVRAEAARLDAKLGWTGGGSATSP